GDAERLRLRAGGACEVLLQGEDGQDGDDADQDERCLHDAGGDEADRGAAADAPGHGVQQYGGGDAGGGGQELEHRSPLHGRGAARVADVPGRVGDDVGEQLQLRDRGGERDEVGDARGKGDL